MHSRGFSPLKLASKIMKTLTLWLFLVVSGTFTLVSFGGQYVFFVITDLNVSTKGARSTVAVSGHVVNRTDTNVLMDPLSLSAACCRATFTGSNRVRYQIDPLVQIHVPFLEDFAGEKKLEVGQTNNVSLRIRCTSSAIVAVNDSLISSKYDMRPSSLKYEVMAFMMSDETNRTIVIFGQGQANVHWPSKSQ